MGMALELAHTQPSLPDWQATFLLARRFRRLDCDSPEPFEQAAAAYCERTDRPVEDFWLRFLVSWPRVRQAEGEDVFAWAAAEAERQPFAPARRTTRMYAAVASIAWHLAGHTGGRFWLPRKRLAALLKTRPNTICDVVTLLVRDGLLRCVDPDYSRHPCRVRAFPAHLRGRGVWPSGRWPR
jgi:hypothetical protein